MPRQTHTADGVLADFAKEVNVDIEYQNPWFKFRWYDSDNEHSLRIPKWDIEALLAQDAPSE